MKAEDVKSLIDDLLGDSPYKGDRQAAKHAAQFIDNAEKRIEELDNTLNSFTQICEKHPWIFLTTDSDCPECRANIAEAQLERARRLPTFQIDEIAKTGTCHEWVKHIDLQQALEKKDE